MFKKSTYATIDTPTNDLYINEVIQRTPCDKHEADTAAACYYVYSIDPSDNYGPYRFVCNQRALRAGFNGRINQSSLVRNHIKKNKEK